MSGGARPGAGRKTKNEEQELIEALKPMHPQALKAMQEGLKKEDFRFVKLYMQYFYGNPKPMEDTSSNNLPPNIINLGNGSIPFGSWSHSEDN